MEQLRASTMGSGVCRGPLPPGPYGPLLKQVLPKSKRGVLDVVALETIAAEANAEESTVGVVAVLDALWKEALRDTGRDRPGPLEAFDLCSAALLLPLDSPLSKPTVEACGLTMMDRLIKATGSTALQERQRIVFLEALDLWRRSVQRWHPADVCRKSIEAAEKRLAELELPQHCALSLDSAGWLALLGAVGGDPRGLSTVARAAYCDGRLPFSVAKYAAAVGGSMPFVDFVSVLLDCFGSTWIAGLHASLCRQVESSLDALKKPTKLISEEDVAQMTEELLSACFASTGEIARDGKLGVLADVIGALQATSVKVAHHKAAVDKTKRGKDKGAHLPSGDPKADDDDADSAGSEGEPPTLPSGERALPRLQSGPACAWQFIRLAIESALGLKFPESISKLQVSNMQRVLKVAVNGVADGLRGEVEELLEAVNQSAVLGKAAHMRRDARDLLKEVGDVGAQLAATQTLASSHFMLRQVGRDAWGLKGLVENLPQNEKGDEQSPSKVKSLVGEDTSSDEGEAEPLLPRNTASAGKLQVSEPNTPAESPKLPPPRAVVEHREPSDDDDSEVEAIEMEHRQQIAGAAQEATPLHAGSMASETAFQEDFSSWRPAATHGLEQALEQDLLKIFQEAGGIPGRELIDIQALLNLILDDPGVAAFFGLPADIQEGDENWYSMQEDFAALEKDLDGQVSWESLAEFFFKHIAPYVHIERGDIRGAPTPSATHMSSVVSSEDESDHIPSLQAAHDPEPKPEETPVAALPVSLPAPVVLSEAQALALVWEDDSTVNDSTMVPPQAGADVIEQPELARVRSRLQASARSAPRQSPTIQSNAAGLHGSQSKVDPQRRVPVAQAELPSEPVRDAQMDSDLGNTPPTTMVPCGWSSGRGTHTGLPSAEAMRQHALISGAFTSMDAPGAAQGLPLVDSAQGLPSAEVLRRRALLGSGVAPDPYHCAPVEVQASIMQVDQAVQAQPSADAPFTEAVLLSQQASKTSARAADFAPATTIKPLSTEAGVSQPAQSSATSAEQVVDQAETTELRLLQPNAQPSPGWPDAAEPSIIPVAPMNSQPTSEADDNGQRRLEEALSALQERQDRMDSENSQLVRQLSAEVSQLMRQLSTIYSVAEAAPQAEVGQSPAACRVSQVGPQQLTDAPSQLQQQSSQCAVQTVRPEAASAQAPFSQLAMPSLLGSGPLVNISFGGNGPGADFNGGIAGQSRFGNDGRWDTHYGMRQQPPENVDIKSAVQRALAEERSQRLAVQAALAAAREWRTQEGRSCVAACPPPALSTTGTTLTEACPELCRHRPPKEVPSRPRSPQLDSQQDVAGVVRNALAGEIKEQVASELRGVGQSLADELRSACQSMQQSLQRQATSNQPAALAQARPCEPASWHCSPAAAAPHAAPHIHCGNYAQPTSAPSMPPFAPSWPPMPAEFFSVNPMPLMPANVAPKPNPLSKERMAAFSRPLDMAKPLPGLGPRKGVTPPCRKDHFEQRLGELDSRMKGLDARFRRLGST